MNSPKHGKLIIFSAPSGAGKTTIVHHLLTKNYNLEFSVSACSRDMRTNEKEGVDYYFLGLETFKQKITENAFLEWEEVYPNQYYGTLKEEVDRILKKGANVIFDVDVEGGLNIKSQYGSQALAIFVMAPSIANLRERLEYRSTESQESIDRRIEKASKEMAYADRFDETLLNDNIEAAFIRAEKLAGQFLHGNE